MSPPQYIHDINPQNFNQMVLDNSRRGPVMVYYWSPNAGPCMRLLPRLVKLCDDFGGRFLLTLMNTDRYSDFARQQDVISIPTVHIYQHEKLVETVHGAYSEQMFRNTIEKYLPRSAQRVRSGAIGGHRHATSDESMTSARGGAKTAPPGTRARLDRAKALVQQGHHSRALDVLETLPDSAFRDPEIDLLATHLRFIRAARQAPSIDTLRRKLELDPDDVQSRYELSACLLVDNEYAGALEQLSVIAENKSPLQQQAYRGMLAIFAILGPDHELCKRFERVQQPSL